MIKELFLRLKKKALPRKAKPDTSKRLQASTYTEEEARKVKERLQGLGYLD